MGVLGSNRDRKALTAAAVAMTAAVTLASTPAPTSAPASASAPQQAISHISRTLFPVASPAIAAVNAGLAQASAAVASAAGARTVAAKAATTAPEALATRTAATTAPEALATRAAATTAPEALATRAAAETADKRRIDEPVVATYQVRDDDVDGWFGNVDRSQGADITLSVVGALPYNLADRGEFPYWFAVTLDEGLTLAEGKAAQVRLVHADGSSRDVTQSLAVTVEDGSVTAGSSDLRAAIPGLAATDTLVLTYTVRLSERSRLGLTHGNVSTACIRYRRASEALASASQAQSMRATLVSSRVSVAGDSVRTAACETTDATSAATNRATATGTAPMATAAPGSAAPASVVHPAADAPLTATDTPADDLTTSPEVSATIYSFELEAHVVAKGSDTPLAGARLALQDSQGRWYVSGGDWTTNREQATTATTNASGNASFRGVGSGTYRLVELTAPTGHAAADPVDVTIAATIAQSEGERSSVSATSRIARTVEADAASGLVTATFENDPLTPGTAPGTTTPNPSAGGDQASNNGGSNRAGTASGLRMPRTGDLTYPMGLAVAISVLTLLGGLAIRRGAGQQDACKQPSGTGPAGQEEGN